MRRQQTTDRQTTDRQTEGWTDRRTDRQTDVWQCVKSLHSYRQKLIKKCQHFCCSNSYMAVTMADMPLLETNAQHSYKSMFICPGFPLFYWPKNPGLFQDPMKNFPGPAWHPKMSKYKEKRHLLTIFDMWESTAENLARSKMWTLAVSNKATVNINWVPHCCCLFSTWTTRKMHDFQGYFSRTLQVLKFSMKKISGLSKTFQEAWEPCMSQCHSLLMSSCLPCHQ